MKIWNKIKLLASLLCCMILVLSCSEDDTGKDNPGLLEETFLSFRLSTDPSKVETRSGVEYGTAAERKVSQVHLLLYEQGDINSKLLYNFALNAQTDGTAPFEGSDVVWGIGPNAFTSKALKVEKQNYQLIVLVNATAAILDKAKPESNYPGNSNTLKDIWNAISAVPADFYDATTACFFMSNAGGIIQVPEYALYTKADQATNNPVTVPVDRILAKVLVYENTDTGIQDIKLGGTLGEVTWGLSTTNKQTYLVRRGDKLQGGNTTENGFYPERAEVYAEDPNFTDNKNITDLDKHFNYLELTDNDFKPWNAFADKGKPAAHYQYTLENTISKEDQNDTNSDTNLYITHVLLKVIITEPGTGDKQLTGENDYYSYTYTDADNRPNWVVFTHEQAVEWKQGVYPADMLILKEDQVFQQAHAIDNSPFNFNVMTGMPAQFTTTGFGLTYHKSGLNVYRIPIMHFGTDGASEGDYGYYGIVRNNTYKIVIKSINGPGTGTSNEGFLSTEITVNNWYSREWEEDLDPER